MICRRPFWGEDLGEVVILRECERERRRVRVRVQFSEEGFRMPMEG